MGEKKNTPPKKDAFKSECIITVLASRFSLLPCRIHACPHTGNASCYTAGGRNGIAITKIRWHYGR